MYIMTESGWKQLYQPTHSYAPHSRAVNIVGISATEKRKNKQGGDTNVFEVISRFFVGTSDEVAQLRAVLAAKHKSQFEIHYL